MKPRTVYKRLRRRASEQLSDLNVRLEALKEQLDQEDAEEKFSPSDYYRRDRDTEKPR